MIPYLYSPEDLNQESPTHLIIDAYFPGYIPSSKQSVYTDEERKLIRRLLDERPAPPTAVPQEPLPAESDKTAE